MWDLFEGGKKYGTQILNYLLLVMVSANTSSRHRQFKTVADRWYNAFIDSTLYVDW